MGTTTLSDQEKQPHMHTLSVALYTHLRYAHREDGHAHMKDKLQCAIQAAKRVF